MANSLVRIEGARKIKRTKLKNILLAQPGLAVAEVTRIIRDIERGTPVILATGGARQAEALIVQLCKCGVKAAMGDYA